MLLDKLSLLSVRIISNTQINCVDGEESVLKQLVITKATVLEGQCCQTNKNLT
jgi:hypothetical protein